MKLTGMAMAAFYFFTVTACTTSQWVDGPRKEVISESAATTIRPVLRIEEYPGEKPEVTVQLLKELNAPIELQEERYELIHTVWGTSLDNVLGGWGHLMLAPGVLVGATLSGTLGKGIRYIGNSLLAAMGFNLPKDQRLLGADYHIPDRKGEIRIEKRPYGTGARQISWARGELIISGTGFSTIRLTANDQGRVRFALKEFDLGSPRNLYLEVVERPASPPGIGLPLYLTNGSQDLVLTLSTQIAGNSQQEAIRISASTIRGWWPKVREEFIEEACKDALTELRGKLRLILKDTYRAKLSELSDSAYGIDLCGSEHKDCSDICKSGHSIGLEQDKCFKKCVDHFNCCSAINHDVHHLERQERGRK